MFVVKRQTKAKRGSSMVVPKSRVIVCPLPAWSGISRAFRVTSGVWLSGLLADAEFGTQGGGRAGVQRESDHRHGTGGNGQHHRPGFVERQGFAAGGQGGKCEFAGGGDGGGAGEVCRIFVRHAGDELSGAQQALLEFPHPSRLRADRVAEVRRAGRWRRPCRPPGRCGRRWPSRGCCRRRRGRR